MKNSTNSFVLSLNCKYLCIYIPSNYYSEGHTRAHQPSTRAVPIDSECQCEGMINITNARILETL